jgi:hypothetical protein
MRDMSIKSNRVKALKREQVKRALAEAAKKGRGGDDRIVHINPQEEQLLKAAGGAGTVNPDTGLKEFKYGGNVSEGGKKQGAADAGGQGPNAGGGGSNGGNQGGMSPSLLDSKYPGARNKKVRQYEDSWSNLAKVGTIAGSLLAGPAATAAKLGLDALSGDLSLEGMLDPFSGRMPDVPSTGAGYAQGSDRSLGPATEAAARTSAAKRTIQPKKKKFGFSLLSGMPGTLMGN